MCHDRLVHDSRAAAFWQIKLGQSREGVAAAEANLREARARRVAAVKGAREAGLNWRQIGEQLRVTAARAEQLSRSH